MVVPMRDRAVGAAGESDAVGAERAVAGTGVGQQKVTDLGQMLGVAGADDVRIVRLGHEDRHLSLALLAS
ncbi:hypothetical protein [Actinomadura xylanilytica]|uniref:hypothetical protein n=1 Tax=Actinomadura xylanilytica TaxID=887459 RepID=UPI00255B2FED|nr:hypothetical protein [Actinomadura xylanilytica]MDL4776818.1 hypothetical protein [Actinomadura xylanilytica]